LIAIVIGRLSRRTLRQEREQPLLIRSHLVFGIAKEVGPFFPDFGGPPAGPIVTIKHALRSKGAQHEAVSQQQVGMLMEQVMSDFDEILIFESDRLSRLCTCDQMDEASGLHKVGIFALQAAAMGQETVIYGEPSLMAGQVFVIVFVIEYESEH